MNVAYENFTNFANFEKQFSVLHVFLDA